MLKKLLLAGMITLAIKSSIAQFGLYASAVYIHVNGSSTFYNNTAPGLGQDIGSQTFQGNNFGVFEQLSGNLRITGSEIKTFNGIADDVCSGTLNFTIYAVGSRPASPVFTQVQLGFYSDCFAPSCGSFFGSFSPLSGGGCCTAGDQKWQNPGNGVPVNYDLTNNPPGVYTLEVYYEYTGQDGGNGCGTTKYDNNNNNPENYTAGFTITAPVPVHFGSIQVQNNITSNRIFWKTHSEAHTSVFKLERSANGNQFHEIGEVPAAGFSSATREYFIYDRQPLNGLNYYRIKMMETDGRFQHSAIVKTYNKYTAGWNLVNNHAQNTIGIYGLETGDEIILVNPSGQKLFKTIAKGRFVEIPTSGLANGIHFIRVVGNSGTSVKPVFIAD